MPKKYILEKSGILNGLKNIPDSIANMATGKPIDIPKSVADNVGSSITNSIDKTGKFVKKSVKDSLLGEDASGSISSTSTAFATPQFVIPQKKSKKLKINIKETFQCDPMGIAGSDSGIFSKSNYYEQKRSVSLSEDLLDLNDYNKDLNDTYSSSIAPLNGENTIMTDMQSYYQDPYEMRNFDMGFNKYDNNTAISNMLLPADTRGISPGKELVKSDSSNNKHHYNIKENRGIVSNKITENQEIEQAFKDFVNEVHQPIDFFGKKYDPATVLIVVDKDHFNQHMNKFGSSFFNGSGSNGLQLLNDGQGLQETVQVDRSSMYQDPVVTGVKESDDDLNSSEEEISMDESKKNMKDKIEESLGKTEELVLGNFYEVYDKSGKLVTIGVLDNSDMSNAIIDGEKYSLDKYRFEGLKGF